MLNQSVNAFGTLQDAVLHRLDETAAPFLQKRAVHELFEEQAAGTPDAIAVVHDKKSLTYAELNRRANQIAQRIRKRGVGPDQPVGLCIERGLDMVAGVLGIVKAGGAYMPLDPHYPAERLKHMLDDAVPKIILTQESFAHALPLTQAEVVPLDERRRELPGYIEHNIPTSEIGLTSQSLVYVIYTSGSTGRPKGTGMNHSSMVNLIEWHRASFPGGAGQRVLQFAALSFDVAFQEIFTTLCTGGTLVLLDEWVRRDARALCQLLRDSTVQRLFLPPLMLQSLAESAASTGVVPRSLQDVITAGEQLRISPEIRALFKRLGGCRLHNHYGPTETHVVTALTLHGSPDEWPTVPSIGAPIANTQIYVLDERRQLVEVGTVGEIYIAGAGVARGYLGQADLTAQRFVRNPFSGDVRARMYKTGDLGRWCADGTVEYIGRNDHQVKVRGFRVELGEIEAQLLRHPRVKEVAVLAREDVPGGKRLVAYFTERDRAEEKGAVASELEPLSATELRAHVKDALPDFMVPAAFVHLKTFPHSPNGKLDRGALPAPDITAFGSREYEEPETPAERLLAEIWQELLRLDRVGRQDNFFELGGQSLLIVQLLERLRSSCLTVDVRSVYASATLADMACQLQASGESGSPGVPPNRIEPGSGRITPEMLPLLALDQQHIDRIVSAVPGGASNIQDIYPLTPLQEEMLFQHLLNTQSDAYVLSTVFELRSRARLDELMSALQGVMNRHDALRTAILWEDLPYPVQVVYSSASLPIEEIELERARAPLDQLKERMRPDLQRLDLCHAPLMRLQVARHADGVQWFAMLQLHHIVADNDSHDMVLAEVATFLEGRGHELPPSAPYRNHVAQAVTAARAPEAEQFFRAKLKDIDEPSAPFGLMDVRGDGSRVEEVRQSLEPSLAQRLRSQARRLGVSPATLFHAACGLVIARTSGRGDVVFGSVLLGRLQGSAGAQRILGMFINTLPLRLQLEGLTVRGLIEHTQRELVELLAHEQASLAMAQRCSGVEGSTPLFTALLNYRHSTATAEGTWNVRDVRMHYGPDRTNYPVVFAVDDFGESGFDLTAQTDRALEPRRLFGFFSAALRSLVDALEHAPQTSALTLQVLADDELQAILRRFSGENVINKSNDLVHQAIEAQVARTPDAIAVVYEDQSLSYTELNTRANCLARWLRAKGVGPDQLVGVCVERSSELAVALLGILKAGGAYVPIDPGYPAERLEHMLQDAALKVLLTQERLRHRLPRTSTEIVSLDRQWSEIEQHPATNLSADDVRVGLSHLAYVIFTSGSTGKPKAAQVQHRGLQNLMSWYLEDIHLSAEDTVLLVTSQSFDLTQKNIFGPLMVGGVLSLASEPFDPSQILQQIRSQHVTHINLAPSAFYALIDANSEGQLSGLKRVVLGGEPIQISKLLQLPEPRPQFINSYGPTECSDVVVYHLLDRDLARYETSGIPLGIPVRNARIYILDSQHQPVPLGVVGEICIGGVCVGRGYLNQSEMTAQRFLKDPFSAAQDALLYKTGDIGRWRVDGTIEYLGRNDHQVKIRGFRIELGEIETQLARHPQAKEVAVVAREDVPGEKRLVAYVIPRESGSVVGEDLRAHLQAALPDYMIPSAYVVLQKFPLSPNGKLDRRALPAPDARALIGRTYEPPQGEVEEILAGIWQSLLRVGQVGRLDNFFELGGHSLLVVRMRERLRQRGLSAELRWVFESPKLADLARTLTRGATPVVEIPPNLIPAATSRITPEMLPLLELDTAQIEHIVRAVPGGAANVKDIYPLAPLQEGILFHHLLDVNRGDTYILPTLLSFESHDRLQQFVAALQTVIDRHDVLRTAVLWEDLPRPVQVVYRQADVPVYELRPSADRDALSMLRDLMHPERQRMNLRRAPLLRLNVAPDRDGQQWHALLQFHHITCDHVTTEDVVSEVIAILSGRASELPPSIPYRTHVAQALAYAKTHESEAFFRRKLGDVDQTTAPFGIVDVRQDGTRIVEAGETLDADLAARLRAQARRHGVSAATLFHAAWGLVMAHTSGRDNVVFGTVLLGRLQGSAGAQHILGMFINTLPIRFRLDNTSAQELVEHAQRELIELLNHEQASLAEAQRCSGMTGGAPLFTAILNYRHTLPNPETQWGCAPGVQLLQEQERTNFPIALSVDDLGQGFVLTAQTDQRIDAKRLTAYLRTAAHSLVTALEIAPQTPALALSIIPEAERRKIVAEFNHTGTDYPRNRLTHELFEERAARHPQAFAVEYESQCLTYAQLNAHANQLAHFLKEQGIETGEFLPVRMPRGLQLLIAQLAVLKCGAVYVPVDPHIPLDRQVFIVKDCGARYVLAEQARMGFEALPVQWIELDANAQAIARFPEKNLDIPLPIPHPAYVMYTSGSTGVPKGVVVPHHAINRLVLNVSYASITPSDVISHSSNPAFDAATFEIWSALLNGARLVIVPQSVLLDGRQFCALLRDRGVTVLWITVGLFMQYVDDLAPVFESLKYLITGGDVVDPGAVRRVLNRTPPRHILNAYGPTEGTTFATTYQINSIGEGVKSLPIGAPVSNSRVYILDARMQPVPLGVTGEIYVGGDGVALGYLNRESLTAERFVADPFSSDPAARLYKTGDLGRWREDGNIDFLGRNDQQVKLRGFRVELGEIEAQIAKHPQIKEAVVIARGNGPSEKRLLAYIVVSTREAPSADELRNDLKATLPEYMIPSAFIALDQLPLTPNGKVDRRSLPEPEHAAFAGGAYEPPEGDVEAALAEIWQDLLQVERVGREDNFFELGGHSLAAMQTLVRIRAALSVDVPISTLFEHPTLKALAEHVASHREQHFMETLMQGGESVEGLLERVGSMSESEAHELMRELRAGGGRL